MMRPRMMTRMMMFLAAILVLLVLPGATAQGTQFGVRLTLQDLPPGPVEPGIQDLTAEVRLTCPQIPPAPLEAWWLDLSTRLDPDSPIQEGVTVEDPAPVRIDPTDCPPVGGAPDLIRLPVRVEVRPEAKAFTPATLRIEGMVRTNSGAIISGQPSPYAFFLTPAFHGALTASAPFHVAVAAGGTTFPVQVTPVQAGSMLFVLDVKNPGPLHFFMEAPIVDAVAGRPVTINVTVDPPETRGWSDQTVTFHAYALDGWTRTHRGPDSTFQVHLQNADPDPLARSIGPRPAGIVWSMMVLAILGGAGYAVVRRKRA